MGSNLGDRVGALLRAVEALSGLGDVFALSRLFSSPPAPPAAPSDPEYVNAAAGLWVEGAVFQLLPRLQHIELEQGRIRCQRGDPRQLDLDILWAGATVIESPTLVVPHPRLGDRPFALGPLLDLVPQACHPTTGVPYRQRLVALGEGSTEPLLDPRWPPPKIPRGSSRSGR